MSTSQKAPKRRRKEIVYKDDDGAEAKKLEEFLFGSTSRIGDVLQQAPESSDDEEERTRALLGADGADGDAAPLFFEDRNGKLGIEPENEDEMVQFSDWLGRDGGAGDRRPSTSAAKARGGRRPVWEDPADAQLRVDIAGRSKLRKLRTDKEQTVVGGEEYEKALRQQHAKLNPRTSWASLDKAARQKRAAAAVAAARARGSDGSSGDGEDEEQQPEAAGGEEEEEEDEEGRTLLQRAGGLLAPRGALLPPGRIETTRLADANQHEPCDAVVQSVEFHPNGQLLMTAALDKKLRFFQVDGVRNPKVQTVFFQDTPIHQAAFAAGGAKVVAGGRRKHFYLYDVAGGRVERVLGPAGCNLNSTETFAVQQQQPAGGGSVPPLLAFLGDQGSVPLVSLASRQVVATLKMSGSARTAAFSPDGLDLLTSGSDGVVYVWDVRMRRCRHQFVDTGNMAGSSMAVAPSYGYLATGSASGIVNVYARTAALGGGGGGGSKGFSSGGGGAAAAVCQPMKELTNLTTTVDTLAFSPDSQMLAMASRMNKDSLRLVHVPSFTVFSNWPTSRSPLHYVHCLAFSPRCGFLAVGNAKGRVLLYRLHHYPEA